MDDTASVATGAWKMKGTYVAGAKDLTPKLGGTALTLGCAEAEQAGAKGDFRVHETVPGETRTIGLWAHLAKDANVARVGIQVYDSEGEALLAVVPAEWEGWKWIEVDLADTEQAYPQSDKNQAADCPLKSVHVVWFSKSVGPSSLAVDAVIASTRLGDANGSASRSRFVHTGIRRLRCRACSVRVCHQFQRAARSRDGSLLTATRCRVVFTAAT